MISRQVASRFAYFFQACESEHLSKQNTHKKKKKKEKIQKIYLFMFLNADDEDKLTLLHFAI